MNPPEVSVVVPTRNRAHLLRGLLQSLAKQTLPRDRFEVVVVDNASTDDTAEVISGFMDRPDLMLRRIVESQPGASAARNRGIREALGEIVAFIDDDCEADSAWLSELREAFVTSEAAAVGGRTVVVWEEARPDWWRPDYDKAFVRNWGDVPREVSEFPFFYSLNLAIRRDVLDRVGLFDVRLGPKGWRHVVGEDADLCRRIHETGRVLLYAPSAVVRHRVETSRISRAFLRKRSYFRGVTHAIHHDLQNRPLGLLYQVKQLVLSLAGWIRASDAAGRFERELEAWRSVGYTGEGMRLHWRRWRRRLAAH